MIAVQSPIARLSVRAVTAPALMVGLYLLFAGHNQPGGGFAAGLVFGAVVALRTVVGLQRPARSGELVAAGMLLIAFVAVVPLVWGGALLDQQVLSADLPLLGKVKSGSALPFDIGVTAVVVGLVISVLDGLGVVYDGRSAASGDAAPGAAPTGGSV